METMRTALVVITELLHRFAQLRILDGGSFFQGEIDTLKVADNKLEVTFRWCAAYREDDAGDYWERYENPGFYADMAFYPDRCFAERGRLQLLSESMRCLLIFCLPGDEMLLSEDQIVERKAAS